MRNKKLNKTLLISLAVVAAFAAIALLLALSASTCGVRISARGNDTSNDLPVNIRSASDFTERNGRISYPGAVTGIDVSSHQGKIDWAAVKADGISFAILRIGYRGYSLGSLNEDSFFRDNLAGARSAGLEVGVYFFSQATSVAEAEEEADYVLSLLDGETLDCPVFFDWEEIFEENSRTNDSSSLAVSEFAAAFCRRITENGYTAGAYFNQQYGYTIMHLSTLREYCFWLAEYRSDMSFFYDVQYWQYTGKGTVDGIATDVDMNLRFSGGEHAS